MPVQPDLAPVTQQPLGGKAQNGGQRSARWKFGLSKPMVPPHSQELLTIKSDDRVGRNKTYEAIIKGYPIPRPGIPEA
jgi:DNA-directed RNA polymerase subunit beta